MCFDVSMLIRLIDSTDGLLCLRSATTSFWHIDAVGASHPSSANTSTQSSNYGVGTQPREANPARRASDFQFTHVAASRQINPMPPYEGGLCQAGSTLGES